MICPIMSDATRNATCEKERCALWIWVEGTYEPPEGVCGLISERSNANGVVCIDEDRDKLARGI